MKKITAFVFIISFFLFTSPNVSIAAEELAQRWVCLNAVLCSRDDSGCRNNDRGHSVRVTAKDETRPLPDATTYIFECLTVPAGTSGSGDTRICTTGSQSFDTEALGPAAGNNLPKLQASRSSGGVEYQFRGIVNSSDQTQASQKTQSTSAGTVGPFEWISFTPGGVPRQFFALNKYKPETIRSGTEGGQQQGTFNFETASKDCVSIAWDPYGKVFDSQSLEPIPEVNVQLLKKNTAGIFTQVDELGVTNPQTTTANGEFSFVVADGTYKLLPALSGYTFPTKQTINTPVYSDVYKGEEIRQIGKLEHRDIPLDSAVVGGRQYPVEVNFFHQTIGTSSKEVIEGVASHPLTKIRVLSAQYDTTSTDAVSLRRGRLLKEVQSDKTGKFRIEIDKSELQTGEFFGFVEWEKTDLTRSGLSLLKRFFVHAQETTSVKVEPILTYIEGYAYDGVGKLLPNSTVGVYLTFADSPYYQTKADGKGYFKITSEYLPFMPYKLRYLSATGSKVDVAPSKFLAQNLQYIVTSKVDVNQYKDAKGVVKNDIQPSGKTVSPPSSFPLAQNKLGGNGQQGSGASVRPQQNQQQSAMLLIVVLLLVLLGAVGILLGFYLYNKNKSPLPPPIPL